MQPTSILPKLSDTTQTISFSEGDGVCSSEVYASEVIVTTNAGNHNHGSSKVKLKNLVDYNWEPKFYPGQLLAVHIGGKYLAYSIKAPNPANPGTWNGMVRVVYSPEPGTDRRTLIKGMKGEVQDLAFAHIQNQVVLACIDEMGNFYVHEIELTDSSLKVSLVVEVREDTGVGGNTHRVVWCPYIPDDEDEVPDDDVVRLLLTTHGNVARMWNMKTVSASGGLERCASARAALEGGGARAAGEHGGPVLAAAFSPDGTALATAAADGYVMFFQVYMMNDSNLRCLHKWQPHDGKPVSCLFFLDNHKNYNTDVQFWKFAITGADNNTLIKVWSCKSWNCLQSISFSPTINGEPTLGLKAMLDYSSSYLLLSDFKARSLYVLSMASDVNDAMAYCKSISEFLLPYPVLSFCIVDAEEEVVKCESGCEDPFLGSSSSGENGDSPDEFELHHDEEGVRECGAGGGGGGGGRRVSLRLYIVQPKGLQEGELVYSPPEDFARGMVTECEEMGIEVGLEEATPPAPAPAPSTILQQQSQQLKNLLMRSQTQPGSLMGQRAESPPSIPPQLNLMTPDAFSSPGKRDEDDPPLSATPDVVNKALPTTNGPEEAVIAGAEGKSPSGGSSPSLEVQQIMSHNEQTYYKEDMEEVDCAVTAECGVGVGVGVVEGGAEQLFPAPDAYSTRNAHGNSPPDKLTRTNSETTWPQISLEQITEANQRKASSDKGGQNLSTPLTDQMSNLSATTPLTAPLPAPLTAPLKPALNQPLGVSAAHTTLSDDVSRARLDALEQKLDKLMELVTAQTREMRVLRVEARAPRELLDTALHEHSQRTTAAIHTAMADGWERISGLGEAASKRAAAAAGLGASRALEPLANALQHELAAKLSATDRLLRDNIDKLATSKTLMERLSGAIATSLSEMVRDSFREALCESVVPVMEKAHAQIFRQINQAFQNGTKEFAAKTESAARAAAERGGMAGAEALRAALERHAEALAAATAQPNITATIRDVTHSVLEKELAWWREQARSVALQVSRAHSPASSAAAHSAADRQKSHRTTPRNCIQESLPFLVRMQVAQIQSLMSSGDVNGAFQLALSASDLALVVAACRAAEPTRVFGPPCRLKQNVLLSLVQQLAADMQRDTQLKHRYLEEAIMNLDTTNPVTREHLPVVLRELQKQVMAFLSANPGHTLTRQFRMLLLAADSLVKAAV
ncbi:PREDICTED: enhancer of mRNA-decapping protein 4 isoform X2 [Papilio xuthus]|uniref:Enhancer of mRNA-decapping protein 4 isoform X2 n=1 Tax=Papilio xuthus TaxID=66420 RepID=A0AAJ6ZXT7_PAPXU|nr:PREDICTED: enhancer of mRNA-decapping protein 4 isoform X2 [Papilio xuthus]